MRRFGFRHAEELSDADKGPEVGTEATYRQRRHEMVSEQIIRRGVSDTRVLAAMARVPRHEFVPASLKEEAYEDYPIPIGSGQTVSQPYIVAFMTEAARLPERARVLEIGTGSGYQTAVLAQMGADVYSLEILPELASRARELLARLGYDRVHVRQGDGYDGEPEHAPYDAILGAAAPQNVPPPLLNQLKIGGRLVLPLGHGIQHLTVITREPDGFVYSDVMPVRFVPMTGKSESE